MCFIGGRNRCILRKPPTCSQPLTNFITKWLSSTPRHERVFELTTLLVIDTDYIGSRKFNYHTITTTMSPNCFIQSVVCIILSKIIYQNKCVVPWTSNNWYKSYIIGINCDKWHLLNLLRNDKNRNQVNNSLKSNRRHLQHIHILREYIHEWHAKIFLDCMTIFFSKKKEEYHGFHFIYSTTFHIKLFF